MKIFCTLLGHTWVPETLSPAMRWNTTKAGHTLVQDDVRAEEIRHIDRCVRCGAERDAGPRRHDKDQADVKAAE